jgi:hypothetical protein
MLCVSRKKYFLGLSVMLIVFITPLKGVENLQDRLARENLVDWDCVKERFAAFAEYPTSENARLLRISLPERGPFIQTGNRSGTLELIMKEYVLIEREAWAGNKQAVECLFRLLSLSDGAMTQDILITLGTLIRLNPELFLEVAIGYQESPFIKAKGFPVYGVEPIYWEKEKAYIYEIEMRIKALEGVKEIAYSVIIEECVLSLQKILSKITKKD